MSYLCPICKRPLRKIRTEENTFFTEEVWNCSACMKNYHKRRNIWIGAQPILADVAFPMISLPPPQPSQVRAASRSFRAAVRRLHTPRLAEMIPTGSMLPLPTTTEVRITDERIGDEPYCYYRLSSPGDPRWIWGPDLLKGDSQIPVYRLQGARP